MSRENKSISRSLGEFFGHLWRGATADVTKGEPGKSRQVVRHEVEEETKETEAGRVTLRRTVIEEVEIEKVDEGPTSVGS